MCIPISILIGGCVSELHAHLCSYRNVWPEVVLQELHCLLTGRCKGRHQVLSVCKVGFWVETEEEL